MPPRKMEGGYINEGGQLKTKNGQKYVVNHKPAGYFVTKGCIALMACAAILALVAVFLLTYFLAVPRCDASTESLTNETVSSASIFSPSRGAKPKQKPTSPEDDLMDEDETLSDQNYESFNSKEDKIHLYEGWNPTRYRLIIEPNIERSINNGSVWIDVTSDPKVHGIQPIILDIYLIDIIDVHVLEVTESNGTTPVQIETNSDSNSTLWIYVKKDFRKNSAPVRLRVFVEFISRLSDTLQGFYKVNYKDDSSGESKWLASTQFSPIEARRCFPSMDRPDKKAEFEISIVRPYEKSMVLSNMPHMFSNTHRPGYVQEDFQMTPRMSTYLVAFIVSDLVESNTTSALQDSPRIRVWSRPEMSDMTGYAHKLASEILPFFENYFNIKFKLPKIDLVAVPDFGFSAMENWGLIFFRESAMLVPEDKERRSSAKHTEHVASILAHELAHQWFGNLVTMKWWSDLWLKEGFANYMSYLALESVEPTWRSRESFAVNELQHAMDKDSDLTSHPISFEVSTPSDVRRIFDPISYSKGASLIRMMNSFLGEEAFIFGVRSYLKRFEYSNAVQNDLWQIMSEIGHKFQVLPPELDVKNIMDAWTLKAGYPMLTVVRNGSDLVITQQRYMLPRAKAKDKSRWFIPITYSTKSAQAHSETPDYWMTDRDEQIVIPNVVEPDEWVYLNVNRTGYYRVKYDYESLTQLSRHFEQLPEITRAQLIDDALNLARAEYVQYDIALTFLIRMGHSLTDVLPWAAATRGLEYLTDMLIREPAFDTFKTVMRHIVLPAFQHLGFDEKDDENHVQLLHRARIVRLACTFDYDRCTNRAQFLFREWIRVPKLNNIKPNLKDTVYCVAIREGGVHEWRFAYKQYLETTSASEKEVLLNALGCTRDPSLLSKYLNMTLYPESGIRKQDGARAFSAVASNSVGFEIAFDFLQSNIEQISQYFGDGFSILSKMVSAATTYMNKEHHLAQFERFIAKAKKLNLKSIESSVKLSIEQVKNNIYWRSRSYYQLQGFLDKLVSDLNLN
ncbi:aminopeptidase N isoform X2 [Phlebotomus argentipes]|uniref:aminopeptidase N isoform X2 n=1 Tax=Phlebotomus argentipes TaxID=94469 RepID=UPI0028932BCF|nr:aminopeptidase N isoform X2 [Phlebotomus argentipes]